jgi:hypothetical protein
VITIFSIKAGPGEGDWGTLRVVSPRHVIFSPLAFVFSGLKLPIFLPHLDFLLLTFVCPTSMAYIKLKPAFICSIT